MSAPVRVVFVCDYTSIHSRKFIDYFLRRPELCSVIIVSSKFATPPAGVHLLNLEAAPRADRSRMASRAFEALYPLLMRWPRFVNRSWARQMMKEVEAKRPKIVELSRTLEADVVHAFRAQPEGVLARELTDRIPGARLFLTTWGHDFVLFGRATPEARAATRQLVERTDVLLADNARDARLGREEWGLRPEADARVMAATGGLDFTELEEHLRDAAALGVPRGSPSLLTMRGFESGYNSLNVVMQAHRLLLRSHPDAFLYIAVPKNPKRARMVERYAERLGTAERVQVFMPDRADLFRHMQLCDINVFATRTDGLSLSLLESMYFGQFPVVAAHDCYTPPLEDGVNCAMFPRNDPDAIADALRRAIDTAPPRPVRTAAARVMLAGRFDRDGNLAQVAGLYARRQAPTRHDFTNQ